jgi:hypothetical protein
MLAAPSVVTNSHSVEDAGPIFADIWDKAANYPVLGSQVGFSDSATILTKVLSLFVNAQPILLSQGQQLGQAVQIEGVTHQHIFFLPKVCNNNLF